MRAALRLLVATAALAAAGGCGPGRGAGRRRGPLKLTPLVFIQHVPNVSENSLAGSGLPEGRVSRNDEKFKDLVPNYNPDIIFKDEEGTGADRLMTQRCKEKLNTLAISVMNLWPGVKLRVLDGWDESHRRAEGSLHYEGRAVDVTTSDRDRGKYGMLARLAVEAGFDWVYYESRSHVHCSVKSESSSAARGAGCFPAESTAMTPTGVRQISSLKVGDMVLAADGNGKMQFSDIIMFIDWNPSATRQFLRIRMDGNYSLTVTPSHLVMIMKDEDNASLPVPSFAATIKEGDHLIVAERDGRTKKVMVLSTSLVLERGVYAPLTRAGTVVVDGVLASCYAAIDSQRLAHVAFAPFRLYSSARAIWRAAFAGSTSRSSQTIATGVHWYADLLYAVASRLLPRTLMYHQ